MPFLQSHFHSKLLTRFYLIQNLTSYERVKMYAFYDFVFVQSFQRILLNFKIHRVTKCVETTGKTRSQLFQWMRIGRNRWESLLFHGNGSEWTGMYENEPERMGMGTRGWESLRMDGNA